MTPTPFLLWFRLERLYIERFREESERFSRFPWWNIKGRGRRRRKGKKSVLRPPNKSPTFIRWLGWDPRVKNKPTHQKLSYICHGPVVRLFYRYTGASPVSFLANWCSTGSLVSSGGSPLATWQQFVFNFKMHFTRRPDSELGQICAQIEALEVYFPMEQTSPSNSLCRKIYSPRSEGMSYFPNPKIFKTSFLLHPISELRVSWAYLEYFRETNVTMMSINFKIQSTQNEEHKPHARITYKERNEYGNNLPGQNLNE